MAALQLLTDLLRLLLEPALDLQGAWGDWSVLRAHASAAVRGGTGRTLLNGTHTQRQSHRSALTVLKRGHIIQSAASVISYYKPF